MRHTLTPAEKAQLVESRLYGIARIPDKQSRRLQFNNLMNEAEVSDSALQRELWLSMSTARDMIGIERVKRPQGVRCLLCGVEPDYPLVTVYIDEMPAMDLCRECEVTTGNVPLDDFKPR